jgi:nucleoid DNA-binding protein
MERRPEMTKNELVQSISKKAGISIKEANEALNATTSSFSDTLKKGDGITIVGFGSFSVAQRAARTGRNPQTGKTIQIPASKTVRFKPGKSLKEAVN